VPYFLGRNDYAMDERGRVPLPPRYRDVFAHGAVLSQGAPDRCLRLFTSESFEREAARYTRTPGTRRAGRITRHAFFPRSSSVELDKQGRILIPTHLRDFAGLRGTVVVVGAGEWLEIWDPERFETEMALVDDQLEDTLEALEPDE
jgi:MraZ protein